MLAFSPHVDTGTSHLWLGLGVLPALIECSAWLEKESIGHLASEPGAEGGRKRGNGRLMLGQRGCLDQFQSLFDGFLGGLGCRFVHVALENDFSDGKVGLWLGHLRLPCEQHGVRVQAALKRSDDPLFRSPGSCAAGSDTLAGVCAYGYLRLLFSTSPERYGHGQQQGSNCLTFFIGVIGEG